MYRGHGDDGEGQQLQELHAVVPGHARDQEGAGAFYKVREAADDQPFPGAHLLEEPGKKEHHGQLGQGGDGVGYPEGSAVAALADDDLEGEIADQLVAGVQAARGEKHGGEAGIAPEETGPGLLPRHGGLFEGKGREAQRQKDIQSRAGYGDQGDAGFFRHLADQHGEHGVQEGARAPADAEIHFPAVPVVQGAQGVGEGHHALHQHDAGAVEEHQQRHGPVGGQRHQRGR